MCYSWFTLMSLVSNYSLKTTNMETRNPIFFISLHFPPNLDYFWAVYIPESIVNCVLVMGSSQFSSFCKLEFLKMNDPFLIKHICTLSSQGIWKLRVVISGLLCSLFTLKVEIIPIRRYWFQFSRTFGKATLSYNFFSAHPPL